MIAGPLRLGGGDPAYACYCFDPEVASRIEHSDIVFVGTFEGRNDQALNFTVSQYLKGDGEVDVWINGGNRASTCSAFEGDTPPSGGKYLIFANETGGGDPVTDGCAGNVEVTSYQGNRDYREALSLLNLGALGEGSAGEPALDCPYFPVASAVQTADLVFVGSISAQDGTDVHFDVDRYFKGTGQAEVTVDWLTLGGVASDLAEVWSGRHMKVLVFAARTSDGSYTTDDCAGNVGFAIDSHSVIAEIEAITGPGTPPQSASLQEEDSKRDKDTPWAVVLPLAFAIPLAVLLVPAFLRKRTPGGH